MTALASLIRPFACWSPSVGTAASCGSGSASEMPWKAYQKFAEEYCEWTPALTAIRHVYGLKPLTPGSSRRCRWLRFSAAGRGRTMSLQMLA
jgi:hypothetical protein